MSELPDLVAGILSNVLRLQAIVLKVIIDKAARNR